MSHESAAECCRHGQHAPPHGRPSPGEREQGSVHKLAGVSGEQSATPPTHVDQRGARTLHSSPAQCEILVTVSSRPALTAARRYRARVAHVRGTIVCAAACRCAAGWSTCGASPPTPSRPPTPSTPSPPARDANKDSFAGRGLRLSSPHPRRSGSDVAA